MKAQSIMGIPAGPDLPTPDTEDGFCLFIQTDSSFANGKLKMWDGANWTDISDPDRYGETTSSVADVYEVIFDPELLAYNKGDVLKVKFNATNAGPATLAPNALPARTIVLPGGSALSGGEIVSDGVYLLFVNDTNLQLLSGGGASIPDLTGNENKVLSNDGENLLWKEMSNGVFVKGEFANNAAAIANGLDMGDIYSLPLLVPGGFYPLAVVGVDTSSTTKQLTVNSSTAQTSYPVYLTLNNSSGTDTVNCIYLNGKVRSDWGDVRFRKSDGTYIPFGILSKTATSITVAFLADLNVGNTIFYLCYNKPATNNPYKIACLTDIHYDPNTTYVNRQFSLDYIDNFVARMATYLPDLAVNNGDKIGESNNTIANETTRLAWYQANMDHFAPVSAHATVTRDGVAMGNHDCDAFHFTNVLAKHSAETWMQPGVMYGYWESSDFRFISLDANYVPGGQTHVDNANQGYGYINTDQLTWLTNTLAASTKPCIIFCHQCLGEMETGVLGLTKETYHVQNRTDVRTILENSGKVACVIQGHMHWHRYDIINSIPYLVMEDISEARSPDEFPTGTSGKWNLIEIDKEACIIRFKLEAKVGANYFTVQEYSIPYKTSFDSDTANFAEKVFASGNAATYSKASILSDASQLYLNNTAYILASPHNEYANEPYLSDKTIKISGLTNAANYGKGQFYFAPQIGSFKLKFAIRMVHQKTKYFKIGNGAGADTTPGPYMGFNTAGNIFAVNASNVDLQAYNLNTWYDIEIIIDVAANKYSVKVDGVLKASLYSFLNANTTLNQLQIQTETGDCFIDNLRIEKYTSTEPSITSVGSENPVYFNN